MSGKWGAFFRVCPAIVILAACSERMTEVYAGSHDERLRFAIQRGIVPSRLPSCARMIRSVHDVDTGQVWGTWDCGDDGAEWVAALEAIGTAQPPEEPGYTWWRVDVAGTTARIDDVFLVRFDGQSGRFYFWSEK